MLFDKLTKIKAPKKQNQVLRFLSWVIEFTPGSAVPHNLFKENFNNKKLIFSQLRWKYANIAEMEPQNVA